MALLQEFQCWTELLGDGTVLPALQEPVCTLLHAFIKFHFKMSDCCSKEKAVPEIGSSDG